MCICLFTIQNNQIANEGKYYSVFVESILQRKKEPKKERC